MGQQIKQIERQLILYDIFRSNGEDTRKSTIEYLLPGVSFRTIQRDLRDLKDAGLLYVYYSRDRDAYINYADDESLSFYSESIRRRIEKKRNESNTISGEFSPRRKKHLERLKRFSVLMNCGDVYENAVEIYFSMFPGATERMRKRDFEVLRHIGYNAGFDRETNEYVLYQKEDYNIYDGYGVYLRNGKTMIY